VVGLVASLAGLGQALADPPETADTVSFFADTDTSVAKLDPQIADLELGLRFGVTEAGALSAVRFLKAPGDVSHRTVSVWDARGGKLATVASSAETPSGWQTVALAEPIALKPGRSYVVSYHAQRYRATEHYFDQAVTAGPLTTRAQRGGVFAYGSGFPASTYRASNYWADVVFTVGADGTAPTPTTPTPTAVPTTATSTPTTPTAPTAPTAPTTPAPSGSLSLPRVPWDSGAAFYSKFARAKASGWSDPGFFPISVFLGKPGHAEQLKKLGINTYMGAEHDGTRMSTLTGTGMSVLAQDEWSAAEVGDDPRVVGWLVSDECDMGLGCAGKTAAENLAAQKKLAANLRSRNDGRFLQANYGNGVLDTFWAQGTMSGLVRVVDVASVDKYAYTSPHVQGIIPDSPHWPAGAEVASSGTYGWLGDRLQSYLDPAARHPSWVFVETARPYLTEAGSTVIQPNQIEGAVWSALIHEARGIAYFQHSNDPTCATYSLVDCDQARKDKVTTINAQVRSLAPVLNSQSYVWDARAGADTMLKAYNGNAYLFAGIGLKQSPGKKTFTLPPGLSGSTVSVVDENRTLPITDGTFTDTFAAEYTHHIYKIKI